MTAIEVTPKHPMLLFFYYLFWAPIITIDGTEHKAKWNKPIVIDATAGSHQVDASYKVYWVIPAGKASTSVTVTEGATTSLVYKPPFLFFFMKGQLNAA